LKWQFTNERPIYAQIVDILLMRILTGTYPPGSNMPSVRVLAAEAQVNPNTMQRALAELENRGLLQTQRTAGRTITEDTNMLKTTKKQKAMEIINDFFKKMGQLGIGKEETIDLFKSADLKIQSEVE
jgi:DNA-binding transcriptional regulator YhcF (GntR family)